MRDMFTDRKFFVISYDIVKDKARNKVMKLLKGNGNHTQKSVFECLLSDKQIDVLMDKIKSLIDCEKDSVRIYFIAERDVNDIKIIGQGEVYEEKQLILL
jgi:CRISPR-associated protein Cas2